TGLPGGEVEAAMNVGRIGSLSGGGVGGNMLRAKSSIEQYLARVQSKIQAQLLIFDESVSSQEPERVIEVCHCLLEIAKQKVRNALLERSMYDPTVEEDLCGIRNVVEGPQRRVKVVVVVEPHRLNPSLDFLYCNDVKFWGHVQCIGSAICMRGSQLVRKIDMGNGTASATKVAARKDNAAKMMNFKREEESEEEVEEEEAGTWSFTGMEGEFLLRFTYYQEGQRMEGKRGFDV
ncbi:MAG: hypothetical protein Q9175_003802, partial [Cornicularia normoerica]